MAVFFFVLGAVVCYGYEEHKYKKTIMEAAKSYSRATMRSLELYKEINKLKSELKKDKEEHYLTD